MVEMLVAMSTPSMVAQLVLKVVEKLDKQLVAWQANVMVVLLVVCLDVCSVFQKAGWMEYSQGEMLVDQQDEKLVDLSVALSAA